MFHSSNDGADSVALQEKEQLIECPAVFSEDVSEERGLRRTREGRDGPTVALR